MANVLVTGNLGYNGSWVVKTLLEKGYSVVGLDNDFYSDCFFDYYEFAPQVQLKKDIRAVQKQDLAGIDFIVHLAALANDALGELSPETTFQINHQATVNLALLAKQAKVKKFIFASSCSAYGLQESAQLANENSSLNPLTAYAKAKVLAENDLQKLHSSDFQVVVMRNGTMHGLSPKLRLDLVVNNLTALAYIYKKVKILSDGTPWRPLLSVKDFADIVLFLLENNCRHIVYNVGFNEENYQVKDIGEKVAQLTGAALEINKEKTPDERSYRVDFSRLLAEFPQLKTGLSVADSIKNMFLSFQENNLTESDFQSPKYFRIRTLKEHLAQGRLDQNLLWK